MLQHEGEGRHNSSSFLLHALPFLQQIPSALHAMLPHYCCLDCALTNGGNLAGKELQGSDAVVLYIQWCLLAN